MYHVNDRAGHISVKIDPKKIISLLDIYQAVECLGSTGQLFGFHDNPNPACPIGHNIHNVLDGKLEDIQTAMEKEMAQTTLKDVVEDTQKRMKLESVS